MKLGQKIYPNVFFLAYSKKVLYNAPTYYSINRRYNEKPLYNNLNKKIEKIKRKGNNNWKEGHKLFKNVINKEFYPLIEQDGVVWKYAKCCSIGGSSAAEYIRLYLAPYRLKLKLNKKYYEKPDNNELHERLHTGKASSKIFDYPSKIFMKYGNLHEPNNILSIL